MQRFETRGVYPILSLPLAFFGFIFVAAIYVRHPLAVLFGLIALPLITDFTAKIGVEKDGVIIKRVIFGTSYWSLDEVRFKAGGRILVYGSRIYGGWIMPFKWRECIKAVEALRPMVPLEYKRAPSKIVPLIYLLVPPTTLTLIGYLVRHVGLVINPAVWAILWGITTASSFAVAVYTAPIRFKIGGLDKAVSSIITSLIIGVIIGLVILMAN